MRHANYFWIWTYYLFFLSLCPILVLFRHLKNNEFFSIFFETISFQHWHLYDSMIYEPTSSWLVNSRRLLLLRIVFSCWKKSFIIQLSALDTRKQQINHTMYTSLFLFSFFLEKRVTSTEQQVFTFYILSKWTSVKQDKKID